MMIEVHSLNDRLNNDVSLSTAIPINCNILSTSLSNVEHRDTSCYMNFSPPISILVK